MKSVKQLFLDIINWFQSKFIHSNREDYSGVKLRLIYSVTDDLVVEIERILSHQSVIKYLPFETPPSFLETEKYLKKLLDDSSLVWVVEDMGRVIGIIKLINITANSAELHYFLDHTRWGEGIATEIIQEVVEYAFDDLNLNHIDAPVISENRGSRRVLEKNHFSLSEREDRKLLYILDKGI